MDNGLTITINTGYHSHPNEKYIEIGFKDRRVRLPFHTLEKFPLNNTPVFFIKGLTMYTPEALINLIQELRDEPTVEQHQEMREADAKESG